MSLLYIKDIKNAEEILNNKEKKLPKFIKKIVEWLRFKFRRFNKKGNIIILPIKENKSVSIKKLQRIVSSIIKNHVCKSVVLCKNLNNNDELKNILNSYNIDILNGRYLYRFLIFDIVDFILKKKNKKIQDIELSIMANELDEINVKSILLLAKKVKRLNIITNYIGLFKRVEQRLYEDGIMIMVSNNKRKSLIKSDIVLNMDFVEENLKEYKFNNNCIIVNISSDIKIYNKGFNGININNYNIDFENKVIDNYGSEFDNKLLYESKIYDISDFDKILDIIRKDNVIISGLIGNKGNEINF